MRAWRGQNLLLAEQLRADEALGEMAASGAVKTVWLADREPAPGVAAAPIPIEVTAESLSYRDNDPVDAAGAPQSASSLVYYDDVLVRQGSRTIRCQELEVELDGSMPSVGGGGNRSTGDPKIMTCRDDVEILDPAANRQVSGETAVYTVAASRIEVFGDSVRLLDASRNSLVGRYLIYDLDAGNVQLKSRPPAAATGASSP